MKQRIRKEKLIDEEKNDSAKERRKDGIDKI